MIVSYGAGGKHPEAPHLYKLNGYYYLVLAEGGTKYGHMATIFRSRNPYGPYESCPRNPILSHKDFSGSPIRPRAMLIWCKIRPATGGRYA